jgi:hypothetical protein
MYNAYTCTLNTISNSTPVSLQRDLRAGDGLPHRCCLGGGLWSGGGHVWLQKISQSCSCNPSLLPRPPRPPLSPSRWSPALGSGFARRVNQQRGL